MLRTDDNNSASCPLQRSSEMGLSEVISSEGHVFVLDVRSFSAQMLEGQWPSGQCQPGGVGSLCAS